MTDKVAVLTQVEPEAQALIRLIGGALTLASAKRNPPEVADFMATEALSKLDQIAYASPLVRKLQAQLEQVRALSYELDAQANRIEGPGLLNNLAGDRDRLRVRELREAAMSIRNILAVKG